MLSGLFAFFSLPLLLFSSVTVQSNICEAPTTPVIITPAANSTVSSQTTIVSGTTTASSTVTITDNSQPAASVMSDVNGDFEVQVNVSVGQNQLTAQTSNPCGTSGVASETVTVVLPVNPPPTTPPSGGVPSVSSSPTSVKSIASGSTTTGSTNPVSSSSLPTTSAPSSGGVLMLLIATPADYLTTSKASIFVAGTTSVLATETITVNGVMVASLDDLNTAFGVGVPLKIGDNVIRITATANGTATSKVIHITRIRLQASVTPWYTWTWFWVVVLGVFVFILLCLILLRRRKQRK
jgi:hypothetical protein